MVVAITWSVRTRIAKPTSAGSVSDLGSHMAAAGIVVTGITSLFGIFFYFTVNSNKRKTSIVGTHAD